MSFSPGQKEDAGQKKMDTNAQKGQFYKRFKEPLNSNIVESALKL